MLRPRWGFYLEISSLSSTQWLWLGQQAWTGACCSCQERKTHKRCRKCSFPNGTPRLENQTWIQICYPVSTVNSFTSKRTRDIYIYIYLYDGWKEKKRINKQNGFVWEKTQKTSFVSICWARCLASGLLAYVNTGFKKQKMSFPFFSCACHVFGFSINASLNLSRAIPSHCGRMK